MSHDHRDDHAPDGGLSLDLGTMLSRRRVLQIFAGAGAVALLDIGCGSTESASTTATAVGTTTTEGTTTAAADGATCDTPIPQETAGPFPGDGSNGPNVLNQSGVVRRDITTSFAGMSGTAAGATHHRVRGARRERRLQPDRGGRNLRLALRP